MPSDDHNSPERPQARSSPIQEHDIIGSIPESPESPASPSSMTAQRPQHASSRLAPHAAPPSIISSRMTDVGSDDGIGSGPDAGINRRSMHASDLASRPPTALTGVTGVSSSRSAYQGPGSPPQPLRKHALTAHKRRSTGAGSIASSIERASSIKSRSHVPSLTSHAFFHPMSSQKLQAQRAQGRHQSLNMTSDDASTPDEAASGAGGEGFRAASNPWRQSIGSNNAQSQSQNPVARFASETEAQLQPPGSRGTEITGFDTTDHFTANTSVGNRLTGSAADSTHPLHGLQHRSSAHGEQDQQGQGQGLGSGQNQEELGSSQNHEQGHRIVVDTGRSFRDHRANAPSPILSPRSFRSSFVMPGLGEGSRNGSNRDMQGAEKLPSATSSPRVRPVDLNNPETMSKHTAKSIRAERRKQGRVHQYFEGNTFFCLGGRFQNSRQRPINIATGSLIVIPCVLFFIFEASWHWYNLSPAVPITFAYLSYICISSFVHASVTDPGILPRNLHPFPPDPEDDPLYVGPPTNDWTLVKSAENTTAAMEVPVKHCRTCNIWRPPRAHHCRLCDNCIEGHDHHCVWLNNCVGRRNYRFFFVFVTSSSFLCLYLIGLSVAQLLVYASREGVSFSAAMDRYRVTFALLVYGLVAFIYPAALMGYHVFLMARGETTREFINSHKFVKKERYRAFTQGGWWRNWIAILCRPRTPTYYSFKHTYQAGDQRLATRKRVAWLEPTPPPKPPHPQQAVEMQAVKPLSQGTSTAPRPGT